MRRNMFKRAQVMLATLAVGGAPFALSGCDPTARDVVLGGVQAAANGLAATFIDAYFATLAQEEEVATTL